LRRRLLGWAGTLLLAAAPAQAQSLLGADVAAELDRAIAAADALRAGGRSEAQDALSIALERLIADAASRADGEVKMFPTTAPSAKPWPTTPQNAG